MRRNEREKEKQDHRQVVVSTKSVVLTNHYATMPPGSCNAPSILHTLFNAHALTFVITPNHLFPLCLCLSDRRAVPSHSLLCNAFDKLWWHETKGNASSGITTGMTTVLCLYLSLSHSIPSPYMKTTHSHLLLCSMMSFLRVFRTGASFRMLTIRSWLSHKETPLPKDSMSDCPQRWVLLPPTPIKVDGNSPMCSHFTVSSLP